MDLLKINDPEGELPNSFYSNSIKKKINYTSVKKDMICQICIIGAGYTGLSAGLSLAELGYEVVILEEPAETDVTEDIEIDSETGQILPDKYNYLKIENIFTGKFPSSEKLFSIEIALLTKQSTIASDLFIAKMYEIEPDLVAEVTTKILEVSEEQLTNAQGRAKLTDDIREHLNEYLVAQGEFPGITEVFIINLNIV